MEMEIAWINFFGTVLAATIPSVAALVAVIAVKRYHTNKNLTKNLYSDLAYYRHMVDLYADELNIHEDSNRKSIIRKTATENLGYKASSASTPSAISKFFQKLEDDEIEKEKILAIFKP